MTITSPILSFVVAVGKNGVIGRDGQLPWRLSSDLKAFRKLTMGKPLIMGRKTWASLPKALDGRDNIVVTRDADLIAPGALIAADLESALGLAKRCAEERRAAEIMVIGGAAIFNDLMDRAERIYWTAVDASPEGDVYFPDIDWSQWREISSEALPRGPKDEFDATMRRFDRI